LKQISHAYRSGADNDSGPFEVYGINDGDQDIFYLDDSSDWKEVGGNLDQLSVGCNPKAAHQCEIWGVNDNKLIFYTPNAATIDWIDISGSLVRVSVAYGKVENVMKSVIWGVNNSGAAYYERSQRELDTG
jgi:hypothetical protein